MGLVEEKEKLIKQLQEEVNSLKKDPTYIIPQIFTDQQIEVVGAIVESAVGYRLDVKHSTRDLTTVLGHIYVKCGYVTRGLRRDECGQSRIWFCKPEELYNENHRQSYPTLNSIII